MRIAFTGHRDRTAPESELHALAAEFPEASWVHGGAAGFDRQVDATGRAHRLPVEVTRPDYQRHHPKQAPLERNRLIVAGAALLVACYDGRQSGGTLFTINLARKAGIPVRILRPTQDE